MAVRGVRERAGEGGGEVDRGPWEGTAVEAARGSETHV
jgi:hypothetical protein